MIRGILRLRGSHVKNKKDHPSPLNKDRWPKTVKAAKANTRGRMEEVEESEGSEMRGGMMKIIEKAFFGP